MAHELSASNLLFLESFGKTTRILSIIVCGAAVLKMHERACTCTEWLTTHAWAMCIPNMRTCSAMACFGHSVFILSPNTRNASHLRRGSSLLCQGNMLSLPNCISMSRVKLPVERALRSSLLGFPNWRQNAFTCDEILTAMEQNRVSITNATAQTQIMELSF